MADCFVDLAGCVDIRFHLRLNRIDKLKKLRIVDELFPERDEQCGFEKNPECLSSPMRIVGVDAFYASANGLRETGRFLAIACAIFFMGLFCACGASHVRSQVGLDRGDELGDGCDGRHHDMYLA